MAISMRRARSQKNNNKLKTHIGVVVIQLSVAKHFISSTELEAETDEIHSIHSYTLPNVCEKQTEPKLYEPEQLICFSQISRKTKLNEFRVFQFPNLMKK